MTSLRKKLSELHKEYAEKREQIIFNHNLSKELGLNSTWEEPSKSPLSSGVPKIYPAVHTLIDLGRLFTILPPQDGSFEHTERFYNPNKPRCSDSYSHNNDYRVISLPAEFRVDYDSYHKDKYKFAVHHDSVYQGKMVRVYCSHIPFELFAEYVQDGLRNSTDYEKEQMRGKGMRIEDKLPCKVFKAKHLCYHGGSNSILDIDVLREIMGKCIDAYNETTKK